MKVERKYKSAKVRGHIPAAALEPLAPEASVPAAGVVSVPRLPVSVEDVGVVSVTVSVPVLPLSAFALLLFASPEEVSSAEVMTTSRAKEYASTHH